MTTPSNFLKTDSLILIILLAPILYFWWLWPSIPDIVPVHWNFAGEADRFGSKSIVLWIVLGLNVFLYFFLLILPSIAPRKKELEAMGNKYHRLRLVLQLFMTALSFAIILLSSGVGNWDIDILLGSCFILFMFLFGNYVGNIRPNYFLGIRTPWTLQSDDIWRKTHRLAGRLLLAGAFSGIFMLIVLPKSWRMMSVTFLLVAALIFPAIYSFILFKKEQTA